MSTDIPHDPTSGMPPKEPPADLPMIPLPEPTSDMPMISLPDVPEERVAAEAPRAPEVETMALEEFERQVDSMVAQAEAKAASIGETQQRIEDLLVSATQPLSDADDRIHAFGERANAALERLHRAAEEARASAHDVGADVEPMGVPADATHETLEERDNARRFDTLDDAVAGREAAGEEEPTHALGEHAEDVAENEAIARRIEQVLDSIDAVPVSVVDALATEAGISTEAVLGMLARQREHLLAAAREDVDRSAKWKGIAKAVGKGIAYGGAGIGLNVLLPGFGAAIAMGMAGTRLTEAYIGGKHYERDQREGKARERREKQVQERYNARVNGLGISRGAEDRRMLMENIAAEIAVARQRARDGEPPLDGDLTPDHVADATGAYAAERSSELTSEQREAIENAARAEATTEATAAAAEAEVVAARPALQKLRERMGKAMNVAGAVLRGGPTTKERVLTAAVFAGAGLLARESVVVRSALLAYSGAKIGELAAGWLTRKDSERTQRIMKTAGRVLGGALGAALGIVGFSRERAHAVEAPAATFDRLDEAASPSGPADVTVRGDRAAADVPVGGRAPAAGGEAPHGGGDAPPAEAAPAGGADDASRLKIAPEQYEHARFDSGEGFTHPIYEQLRATPDRFGYDPASGRSVDAWAMAETKRIAIDHGFLAEDGVTTTHTIAPDGDVHVVVGVGADGMPNAMIVGDYEKVPYHHVAGAEAPHAMSADEIRHIAQEQRMETSRDVQETLRLLQKDLDAGGIEDPAAFSQKIQEADAALRALAERAEGMPAGPAKTITLGEIAQLHEQLDAYRGEVEPPAVAVAPGPEGDASSPLPEPPPPAVPSIEPMQPPPEVVLEPEPGQPGGSPPEAAPEVAPSAPAPAPEAPSAPAVAEATSSDTVPMFTADVIAPHKALQTGQAFIDATGLPAKVNVIKDILAPSHQVQLSDDLWMRRSGGAGNYIYSSSDGEHFQPITRFNVGTVELSILRRLAS